MKQLIFLFLITVSSLFSSQIDERKTDIYFGNGVWNSEADAEKGTKELQKWVDDIIISDNQQLEKKYSKVNLVFNWTGTSPDNNTSWDTKAYDVIETFYQLRREGQIDDLTDIYEFIKQVMGRRSEVAIETIELLDTIVEKYVLSLESDNLTDMLNQYNAESFYRSHRVLLIAHSQGNMFGNAVYDSLGWQKDYFEMVSIATPAKRVTDSDTPYTTFKCDRVINNWLNTSTTVGIPGHLPGKMECSKNEESEDAHQLIPFYLVNVDSLSEIMQNIENQLEVLDQTPSQWKKSASTGCGCERRIEVKHKFDDTLNASMESLTVIPFDEDAKLYPVGFDYVKASAEGDSLIKYDSGDICIDLLDANETKINDFTGRTSIATAQSGDIEVTLSWDNGADYDLELDMPGSARDVQSCSMEHAYVKTEFSIYPGRYPVNVTKASTESVNGVYYVSISTPGESKVIKVDANTTGHVADIIVKYVDNKPVLKVDAPSSSVIVFENSGSGSGSVSNSGSSSNDNNGVSGHSYIPDANSTACTPAKSCGCMPCEYWVVPYLAQALTGPLSGADVALYHMDGFRTNSATYNGKTSTGNTLYTAGLLNIPEETVAALDDNALYVITVSGGMDIDADDDMIVDYIPTQNLGTLHAILRGSELKAIKPKVNILTEVAYQIVKNDIADGSKTDDEIVATLDDVALRLLRMKIYSQSEGDLSHIDLLEWLPTLEKELLYVSYQRQVVPIVNKLLLGNDIYADAYNLVYVPNGIVPVLQSQVFTALEDISVGTVIGTVSVQYEGNSSIVDMQLYGTGSDKFSIDSSGTIRLVSPLDYETEQLFSLYVRAQNDDGFSQYTAIYVQVEDVVDAPYAVSFTSEQIYSNAAVGTKVGQIVFNVGSSAITSMQLTGEDSTYFSIDNSGNITTTMLLEDFFVKKAYLFDVIASNSSGASRPASIIINVADRRDIPQIGALSANVNENALADTVLAKVPVISDGDSPIVAYTLSDSSQFVIDNNGTIRVAPDALLDYEARAYWNLTVTASNIIGDSRPQNVTIAVNNIPDVLPTLHPIDLSINKETAVGAVVANILSNVGDTPITSFTLSPDSPFSVDIAGNVHLDSSLFEQSIENFTLQASATNGFGESESADINISLIVIPVVSNFSATVFDNTSAGTIIGKINIIGNGNPIESITLSGDGSSDFHVDLNGTIKVADGVTISAARQVSYQLLVTVNGTYEASVQINVLNRIISSVDTPSHARNVVLSNDGTKVYVSDEELGLQIIDISEPTAPSIIASIDTPNYAHGIFLSADDTMAYISNSYSGLQIIDISDPTIPSVISSVNTPGDAYNITLSTDGTMAYVADGTPGLQIIDISDPIAPSIIASVNTLFNALDVILSADGTMAYLSDEGSGLQIIDISDPTVPSIISSVNTPGLAYGVVLSTDGTRAYVADYSSGLQIIDISDPTTPSILASVDTPSYAYGIILSTDETMAYVADGSSGLQIIDISDPTAPSIISSVDTPGYAYDIILSTDGTMAYVADSSSGLQIIDISGIEVPEKVPGIIGFSTVMEENSTIGNIAGKVETVYTGSGGITSFKLVGDGADDFSIDENGVVTLQQELNYNSRSLYQLKAVATNSIGDREVDVTIRVHSVPELQDFTGEVNSMTAEGTYVGQIDIGIDDNTTITDIALIGEGSENFVLHTNGKIFVATGAELHHFVTPQYNLTAIATNQHGSSKEANITINISGIFTSINTSGYARSIAISADGTKSFEADGSSGMQIIDISDPSAPSIIGSVDTPNFSYGIVLSKDETMAYVADGSSGLQIIDISDPSTPSIIGSVDTPDNAYGVILSTDGSKAYVADHSSGLQIIDISDPTTPYIMGSIDTPNNARDVVFSTDRTMAYVADAYSGLQIIDISDPAAPTIIGSVDTPDFATSITLSTDGTKAYIADFTSGVQIIDISDPTTPSIIGSVDTPDRAYKIVLSTDGSRAYVADASSGLQIIDVSDPAAPTIIGSVDTPDQAIGIILSTDGTKAYLADGSSGLQILDLIGLD